MKKILALALAVVMVFGMMAVSAAAEDKTVINLWSFTDELQGMMNKYLELNPELAEKFEIESVVINNDGSAYVNALDSALMEGTPDIYGAEADYVFKYSQGVASEFAATYEELGIDVEAGIAAAEIAPYTIDIGTRPADGKVVALAYQSTGGAFIYRRSIAKDVFGTDDPAVIGEKIGAGSGNWDKFFEAAADCAKAGVSIVSGDGDIWHAIENSADSGWIVDGKLNIDPKREAFLDYSKQLYDNQYSNRTQDWTEQWYVDMGKTADEAALAENAANLAKDEGIEADATFKTKPVLGFYGPAWLINYVMAGNSGGEKPGEGTYGSWRVCAPNVGFCWGGTWVLAGQGALENDAKKDFIKGVIEYITLDTSKDGLQYAWANGTLNGPGGTKDTVASNVVMDQSDGTLDFLGGQDMFKPFQDANDAATGRNMTQYDETINSYWRKAVRQYVNGKCTRDEAIEKFKQNVADNLDVEVE